MELDSTLTEVDPVPDNIFKRVSKVGSTGQCSIILGLMALMHRGSSVLASPEKRDS
jgi:hypothetical protein